MIKKIICGSLIILPTVAMAGTGSDPIQIDGQIRAYDFERDYSKDKLPNQSAFALGGQLNALAKLGSSPFALGASFYTSQTLGLNSSNPLQVDNTLPGYTINVLGQSFLQYQTARYLLRAGNQLIETPWLGASDSRMIPATYQGVFGRVQLDQAWSITVLRIIRYKSRTANHFSRTNLYNPENIGGSGIKAFAGTQDDGAAAFNLSYQIKNFTAHAWLYQFYDFANLAYADARYQLPNIAVIKPYVGLQALREWGDGKNILKPYTAGAANTDSLGIIAGMQINKLGASLAYNNIFKHVGAFKQGDVISPYTTGYATDPLYTTSMISGLVEKSAGQAWKLSADYTLLQKKLTLTAGFAQYNTAPQAANTHETDLDANYHFDQQLQGLSVRYRIGMLNGNSATGQFVYQRLMLTYNF